MEENKPSVGAGVVAWLTHRVCKNGRVNARDGHEQTALHLACESEDEEDHKFIEVLLRSGADINAQDWKGNTPLHMACHRINESVMETLLRSGADVRVVNDEGRTPLHVVANLPNRYRRHVIVVKALLANFTDKGSDEKSSEHLADLAKGDKLVSLVNKQDHRGNTALHLASAQNNLHLVCLLLERDAKVGVRNSDGMTALNMACSIDVKDSCYIESLLGVLINHGEDVNAQDSFGNTPLHTASINKNQKVVVFLLLSCAKVGVKNYEGMTALHLAARACAESVVVALVDYGEYVTAKDFEGNTPLHYVCSQWSKQILGERWQRIANFFIIRGAKIDEQNIHLKTCFDYVATISLRDKLYEKIIEEFAIKQVIRLKSLGLQEEFNINWILGTSFYDIVRTRCCREIEKMKLTKIVKNISLYQVLSHINQPFILPTEDLLPIDEFLSSPDLLTRFPVYGDTLRITFQRAKLLTLAVQSFYSERRKQMMKKLPCEVAEQLVNFLSNEDLRMFIESE